MNSGSAPAPGRGSPARIDVGTALGRTAGYSPELKIGLLSPCGLGNLGDAAIQEAVIGHLRRLDSDVKIVAFTLDPSDTEARHGIKAYPLVGRGAAGQGVKAEDVSPPEGRVTRWADRMEERLFDIRYLGRLWSMGLQAVRTIRDEAHHTRMALRHLRGMDLLIISGGGQLDDFWGGAWGHPYSMFKWATLASLARVRLAILGVGVGELRTPLSRFFIRWALRRACHRSYRDAESREMVRGIGVRRGNTLSADLAFALDPARVRPGQPDDEPQRAGPVVGVSPMAFRDPRVWPVKDPDEYADYLVRLAGFCKHVLSSGDRRMVLFASTRSDMRTVYDLVDELDRAAGAEAVDRMSVAPTDGIDDLFAVLADLDVVVASRLHGVLLSHLAGIPVVALSYDRKVDRHMEAMGHREFALPIETFTPGSCWSLFRKLENCGVTAREVLEERVHEFRRRACDDLDRAVTAAAGGREAA